VEVAVDLVVDRRDDARRAVAEVLAGDAAGEVEELSASQTRAPSARATTSEGVATPRGT
jgi:hypothetical protein